MLQFKFSLKKSAQYLDLPAPKSNLCRYLSLIFDIPDVMLLSNL